MKKSNKKLKNAREDAGLNQDVIAKLLNVTVRTYSVKENGADFTQSEIDVLIKFFGCTYEDLF